MAKKKKGNIHEATLEDASFITTDIRGFVLESPEVFDEALETLSHALKYKPPEPCLTPLEFILRRIESDAKKVLSNHGNPTELDALMSLEPDYTYDNGGK